MCLDNFVATFVHQLGRWILLFVELFFDDSHDFRLGEREASLVDALDGQVELLLVGSGLGLGVKIRAANRDANFCILANVTKRVLE